MRFTPTSEEEAAGCLPKGEYDAVVASAKEAVSQKGNDMIALELTVYGQGGATVTVKDWLLSNDTGQKKLQAFCKSAGLWDTYEAGELSAESCVNRNVTLGLKIEDSDWGPQNRVAYYKSVKMVEPDSGLQGVDPKQQRAAGTGRPDPTQPPTEDQIPF